MTDQNRGQGHQDDQTHTDITHLIDRAKDAFDISSWSPPESEPRPIPKEQSDYIELHEAVEHEPTHDVAEYVKEKTPNIEVPKDVEDLGVEVIDKPVQYPKHQTVKVPLTDAKIMQGKKMPLDSSFRWLAEVCLYILHKAHIRLKMAHGKAVRIFEDTPQET